MRVLYATDRRIDRYLVKALREAGHVVEATSRPADGLIEAATGGYRVIVLDWWESPAAGATRFAAAAPRSLLAVIAAVDGAAMAGVLAAGADAVFTRPASFGELEARLEALDRLVARVRPAPAGVAVEMVAADQVLRVNGRQVSLPGRDFQVMAHMVAHAGEFVSLEQLQQHVWGEEAEPRPDLIRARLARLRRRLADAGVDARLRTVAGQGYVFDVSPSPPITPGRSPS